METNAKVSLFIAALAVAVAFYIYTQNCKLQQSLKQSTENETSINAKLEESLAVQQELQNQLEQHVAEAE